MKKDYSLTYEVRKVGTGQDQKVAARLKAYPGNVTVDRTSEYELVRQREGNELITIEEVWEEEEEYDETKWNLAILP